MRKRVAEHGMGPPYLMAACFMHRKQPTVFTPSTRSKSSPSRSSKGDTSTTPAMMMMMMAGVSECELPHHAP